MKALMTLRMKKLEPRKFIHEIQLLKKFPEVAIGRNVISNDDVIKI